MSEIYTPVSDFPGSPEDALSEEQLLEMLSAGPGEPGTSEELLGADGKPLVTDEGDEAAEAEADDPSKQSDGEPADQAEKERMLQSDYTRKMQVLAEERKQVEKLAAMDQAWATGRPDLQGLILENLIQDAKPEAREALFAKLGITSNTGEPTASATSNLSGLKGDYDPKARDDQGRAIPEWVQRDYYDEADFNHAKATAIELKATQKQLADLGNLVKRLETHLEGQTQREQRNLAATQAAADIGKKLGLSDGVITPQMVAEAMAATGISDPEKAIWAEHGPKIAAGALTSQGTPKPKPKSPAGGNVRTFDPDTVSADEMARLLQAGFKAVRPKTA